MIRRVASGCVALSLLAGCGAGEDYNPLPPETLATAPVKKTPKKRITKPPIAHRAPPTQPIP